MVSELSVGLIGRAKCETEVSAFLTPWGVRECAGMTLREIGDVFGDMAMEFWQAVRNGEIKVGKGK
jgi:hypothetical protein